MRVGRTFFGAVLILIVIGSGLAGAAPAGSGPSIIDEEEECLEPTPAAQHFPDDPEQGATLEVLVFLDGPTLAQGEKVLARAKDSYESLGLELRPTFELVHFEPAETTADGEEISPYRKLVQDAKNHTVGVRPPDIDLVYVMTSKTIDGAAGFADCIGGVRFPNRAFSVGEFHEEEILTLGANFYVDRNAETMSHELGHLMGAHHHYANCGQGAGADDVENQEPAPCTLMFNYLDFTSINFSIVNSSVVKGHALAYAADTPKSSDVEARTVTFSISDHLSAKGKVAASTTAACRAGVPVTVTRLSEEGLWQPVGEATTNRRGGFRSEIEDEAGTYRAQVDVSELEGGRFCRQAASAPAEHPH